MSTQQAIQQSTDAALPTELESPRAKLVYLYLSDAGETTVDDVQSSLGLRKMTLFGVLDTLSTQGYVERRGDTVAAA
ncbi:helix-turn-helix domain-containing protein [Halostella litorea]|uniref:TrmB family transcriptional regulator n=1 Tax=Halostella litorea TaxID=2528831 RepID=UPI0010932AF2|nr:TrmB family transcriptional regulator [Halostella litorea]